MSKPDAGDLQGAYDECERRRVEAHAHYCAVVVGRASPATIRTAASALDKCWYDANKAKRALEAARKLPRPIHPKRIVYYREREYDACLQLLTNATRRYHALAMGGEPLIVLNPVMREIDRHKTAASKAKRALETARANLREYAENERLLNLARQHHDNS